MTDRPFPSGSHGSFGTSSKEGSEWHSVVKFLQWSSKSDQSQSSFIHIKVEWFWEDNLMHMRQCAPFLKLHCDAAEEVCFGFSRASFLRTNNGQNVSECLSHHLTFKCLKMQPHDMMSGVLRPRLTLATIVNGMMLWHSMLSIQWHQLWCARWALQTILHQFDDKHG